ncbi:MAG: Hcp1 family type VI secretion system effector [Deltaproteobacteria bacterium]|nr:MAG: Hcp1 family type VI secretion system effector [Deltaproteobacteria bacterium]
MATNLFLQLDSITGGATDENHQDWIEIFSWSHSFDQPTAPVSKSGGQAAATEMCNHAPISVTKYLDEATYAILSKTWSGKVLPKGKIECFRAGGEDNPIKYLEVEMEDVVVSNYSISVGEGDMPMENISLSYGKVTYNHIPYKRTGEAKGNQPVYHDLRSNKVG